MKEYYVVDITSFPIYMSVCKKHMPLECLNEEASRSLVIITLLSPQSHQLNT